MFASLNRRCFFSLAFKNILSLSFRSFIMIFTKVIFFKFILLIVHSSSCICGLMSSVSSVKILCHCFCSFLSLLSFWNFSYKSTNTQDLYIKSYMSFMLFPIFSIFLPLCASVYQETILHRALAFVYVV